MYCQLLSRESQKPNKQHQNRMSFAAVKLIDIHKSIYGCIKNSVSCDVHSIDTCIVIKN